MLPIVRSRAYDDDLWSIWSHIAGNAPAAAGQLIEQIEARVDALSEFPKTGERVPQFGETTRRVIVGSYLIYYDLFEDRVEVLRALHAARKIEDLSP